MEQDYKKDGSLILNKARLWKNVLAEPPRRCPTVLLVNSFEIDKVIISRVISHTWTSCPKFRVLSGTQFSVPNNVLFILTQQLSEKDRIDMWKNIDIVYTGNSLIAGEAGLSGVDVVKSEVDLYQILSEAWIGSPIRRVEAFDRTLRLLDIK